MAVGSPAGRNDMQLTHIFCRIRLRRAAANLPWVDIMPQDGLNVYSILQRDQLFLTTSALDKVIAKLNQSIER